MGIVIRKCIVKDHQYRTALWYQGSAIHRANDIWESLTEELKSEIYENNSVYAIAEEMSRFSGRYESFIRFLRNNIKYPSDARRNGLKGTVYVNVVIDVNGEVTSAQKMRSHPQKQPCASSSTNFTKSVSVLTVGFGS